MTFLGSTQFDNFYRLERVDRSGPDDAAADAHEAALVRAGYVVLERSARETVLIGTGSAAASGANATDARALPRVRRVVLELHSGGEVAYLRREHGGPAPFAVRQVNPISAESVVNHATNSLQTAQPGRTTIVELAYNMRNFLGNWSDDADGHSLVEELASLRPETDLQVCAGDALIERLPYHLLHSGRATPLGAEFLGLNVAVSVVPQQLRADWAGISRPQSTLDALVLTGNSASRSEMLSADLAHLRMRVYPALASGYGQLATALEDQAFRSVIVWGHGDAGSVQLGQDESDRHGLVSIEDVLQLARGTNGPPLDLAFVDACGAIQRGRPKNLASVRTLLEQARVVVLAAGKPLADPKASGPGPTQKDLQTPSDRTAHGASDDVSEYVPSAPFVYDLLKAWVIDGVTIGEAMLYARRQDHARGSWRWTHYHLFGPVDALWDDGRGSS